MRDKAFLDTNILIYAYSEDEPKKLICQLGVKSKKLSGQKVST